jgi:hypothetical protein
VPGVGLSLELLSGRFGSRRFSRRARSCWYPAAIRWPTATKSGGRSSARNRGSCGPRRTPWSKCSARPTRPGSSRASASWPTTTREAQAMVSVGMGVAMVPKTAVALQHPDVRVISLGSAAPLRRVLLAQRQDKVYAPGRGGLPFHPAGNRPRTGRGLLVTTAARAALSSSRQPRHTVPNLKRCLRAQGRTRRCDVVQRPEVGGHGVLGDAGVFT